MQSHLRFKYHHSPGKTLKILILKFSDKDKKQTSPEVTRGHAFDFIILRRELLSLDKKSKKYQLINAKTSVNLEGNSNFSHH